MTKPRTVSKGVCELCQAIVARSAISRHVAKCLKMRPAAEPTVVTELLHVVAEADPYWLHIDVPMRAPLSELDGLLRNIWLECCYHLSAFTIGGTNYSRQPDTYYGDKPLSVAIGSVLRPGDRCRYRYDFGSTTELSIRVVGTRTGQSNDARLLARNVAPVVTCERCQNPAAFVETNRMVCICDACREKQEFSVEGGDVLPLVNSPRTGVCCYACNG